MFGKAICGLTVLEMYMNANQSQLMVMPRMLTVSGVVQLGLDGPTLNSIERSPY